MKEKLIKDMYSLCEEYNLTEKEKEEISSYVDNLTGELLFLQENKAQAIKYMTYTIIVFLLIMYFLI